MKNALLCCALAAVLNNLSLVAQTSNFGTLPLLQKENPDLSTGQNIESGEKYERVLRIYNALAEARGDRRYPLPKLVLQNAEYRVALINYQDLEIILEEKAFDVCDAFGPDGDAALATLLGHELSHYYEKHAWRRNFVANYYDLNIGIRLDSLHDDVTNETQADYFGGFLAYSAGFGLFEQGTALIDSLYKAYGIPDQISGYPSLTDRQILSQRTAEKLKRLISVFDMANLLTAVGQYREAFSYYKFLLQEYQSREIYNNVGVAAVLYALPFVEQQNNKFHLPLELDLESVGARGVDTSTLYLCLLNEAIRHFDAAISMDPDYAPAYLNKACAYLLLGDERRAQFYAAVEARQAAQRSNMPKVETDVDILLGILAARRGERAVAQAFFEAAAAYGSDLAVVNLNILLDKPIVFSESPARGPDWSERIGTESIYDVAREPIYDESKNVTINKDVHFLQGADTPFVDRQLFINYSLEDHKYSVFLLNQPGYTGQTARGIQLGVSYVEIERTYGLAKRRIQTPRGQLLVYPDIVFVLGAGDTLEHWVLYLLDHG